MVKKKNNNSCIYNTLKFKSYKSLYLAIILLYYNIYYFKLYVDNPRFSYLKIINNNLRRKNSNKYNLFYSYKYT